jgi:hypothetical protein
LDLLGKGVIGRIRTKIKNNSNIGGVPKVLGKTHFGLLTLKIT